MNHISCDKAEIVKEDAFKMFLEGKCPDDYIAHGLSKGEKEGLQKGIQKGRKEGIQEGRKESILNLHKKGYTPKQIADLLDFKLNIVNKIITSS